MLSLLSFSLSILFFFFNDTATTEIYTLSLHDALPILCAACAAHAAVGKKKDRRARPCLTKACRRPRWRDFPTDRKSTRLNSSHTVISYAVFCLKKKEEDEKVTPLLQYGPLQAAHSPAG